ncbi:MAG: hypothetical protein IKO93_07545, partial [Lentisphaeria bacterium]|nr:hypothetical protein [Lentisphaeria bacterium]
PKCDIPDNIQVAVSTFPGIAAPYNPRMKKTEAQVAPWLTIAKGGVLFRAWAGKTMERRIKYIPALKHNYIGQYFSDRKYRYSGAFVDECSDYFIFTYLNLYIFSKLAWNQETDPRALLDEHFTLMFGNAASQMRHFYDDLEKLWNDQILRSPDETGLGISYRPPSEIELWNDIYSPAKLAEYSKLFDQAEKKTSGAERQRIQFIRREFFGKMLEGSRKFIAARQSMENWKIRPGETVFLRPHRGWFSEVQTSVKFEETPDCFIFRVFCEEPFMNEIQVDAKQADSPQVFEDSEVEIFLKPQKKLLRYYQFAVNANGVLADCKYTLQQGAVKSALSWQSGSVCSVKKLKRGWQMTLSIPKKALGDYDHDGFPVNFARRRAFKTERRVTEEYYKWCPYPGGNFHNIDNWGTLVLDGSPDRNLLKNPSFVGYPTTPHEYMGWRLWRGTGNHKGQKVDLDRKYFITGGQSLHLVNSPDNFFWVYQYAEGLKPNTKYKLSFYIRTKDVIAKRESLFSGIYVNKDRNIHFPGTYLSGTQEWNRLEYEFTTPSEDKIRKKAQFAIVMRAPGEVWMDEIRLIEVKPKNQENKQRRQ